MTISIFEDDGARSDCSSVSAWLDGHPNSPTEYNTCDATNVNTVLSKKRRRVRAEQATTQDHKRRRLTETSINIMPSHSRSPKRKADVLASPPVLLVARPHSPGLDPDKTPVPAKKSKSLPSTVDRSTPPPVFKVPGKKASEPFVQHASSSRASESTDSIASSTPSRPSSPRRIMTDYKLTSVTIEKAILHEDKVPSEVKSLVSGLMAISKTKKVIPPAMRGKLEQMGEQVDSIELMDEDEAAQYTQSTQTVVPIHESLALGPLSEDHFFLQVCDLCKTARACEVATVAEPAWNGEVHCRLLSLALRGYWQSKGIWYQDITTAKISDKSLLPAIKGVKPLSKLVDYAITIGSSPDFECRVTEKVNELCDHRVMQEMAINQTTAQNVRFNPIAISIETKREGNEDEADVQLATWTAAHFAKLEILAGGQLESFPALPVLAVYGHLWKVKIAVKYPAREQDPRSKANIKFFGFIILGDTSTIMGTYRVIAGIRRLARWIDEQYRPWFEKEFLAD